MLEYKPKYETSIHEFKIIKKITEKINGEEETNLKKSPYNFYTYFTLKGVEHNATF